MPSRRRVLQTLAAGLAVGAGCAGRADDPATTRTNTSTSTSTTTATTRTTTTTDTSRDCATQWTPNPRWTFERPLLRTPVVTADRVIVSAEGQLFSLAPDDRTVQWRQSFGGHVHTVADGVAIVNDSGRLVGVEVANGKTRWTVAPPTEHAVWSQSLQVYDGTAYVGAAQERTPERDVEKEFGRVYGIDVQSGETSVVTEVETTKGQPLDPVYVLADETGIYTTLDRGGVFAFALDGTLRWRNYGEAWYYRPVRTGSVVVQPWSRGVVAVDTATGAIAWRDDGPEMEVAARNGVVYGAGGGTPTTDGVLWALDAASGKARWKTTIKGCGGSLAVGDDTLATHVGCRDPGHVEVVDTATGCHYGTIEQSSDGVPGLAIGGGTLYVSLQGNGDRVVALPLP